jgi:HAE1 family hydrophobic/amphiphilic exporter-1
MMTMVLIVFVLFGGLAFFGMNLELTPEVALPVITVQTVYPGSGPQEIESQISKKIEDAVSPVSEIDNMQSYSMESVSYVILQFAMSKDVNLAVQEVKDKVDAIINDLPDGVDRPIVQRFDPTAIPVVELILSGNVEATVLYDIADKQLSDRLSQVRGVANVEVTGGQEREIRIEVDNQTVQQHALSLQKLAGILSAQNMDMPGGNVQRSSQEFSIRLKGQFPSIESIRDTQIPTANGLMRLGDIATVADLGEDVRERTSFSDVRKGDGDDDVILLRVMKATDGNAVSIYEEIESRMEELQSSLPEGCEIHVVDQSATFTKSSVEDTFTNILLGIILTSLILLFFLHDYKSTIIVALSMPMSIISTFMFMEFFGFTLNIMSLMGLSTAVGILVTNSVVVLENIFRHKQLGHNKRESASKGTSEIALAVIASTLTNIMVFLPLATMSSIAGRFFQQFSLTVVFATIFSLIMSFTLTPMLASLILPEHDRKKHPLGERLERVFHSWELGYQRFLRTLLANKARGWMAVITAIILFVGTMMFAGNIGFEFMGTMDEGRIAVRVELPTGYDLNSTAEALSKIETRLHTYPEVSHTWTTFGTMGSTDVGSNLALMKVKLVDLDQRNRSTQKMIAALIEDCSDIPNASIRISMGSSLEFGEGDIQFNLIGHDLQKLEAIKAQLLPRFQEIPGIRNLNTSSRSGKPEITLTPKRERLARAGLMVSDLAMALRGSIDGLVGTAYKDHGEEYAIRVVASDESVDTPEEIGQIPVVSASGTYMLEQLADIEFTDGYSRILRKNRSRSILFTADVAEGYVMGDLTSEVNRILEEAELPSGYEIRWAGMAQEMSKTTADIIQAFIIALLLTYMLLAAMLESLTQPLMILGTVPFAMIGVVLALLSTNVSMNIISMLSIVMLIGIVVNNGILLLDYTNILVRDRGKNIHDALLEACPTKLKPIIMSTLAIILGMLPMAIGLGASGAELRQPMGVVSIGGLLVSTVMSLVLIPVLYNLSSRKSHTSTQTQDVK